MAGYMDQRTAIRALDLFTRVQLWQLNPVAAVAELDGILQELVPPPPAEATLPPPEPPASAPEPLQRPGAGVFRGWWVAIRRFGR